MFALRSACSKSGRLTLVRIPESNSSGVATARRLCRGLFPERPHGIKNMPWLPNHMRKIRIICVPLDLGQERRGVDMGPSALRVAGLNDRIRELGFEVEDAGNLHVPIREMHAAGDHRAKYLAEIADTSKRHAHWVLKTLRQGYFPLVLGGDHSIAVGTVAGVSEFYRRKKKPVGLIWVDAHADMNTPETSPSGNIHGMPLD